MQDNGESQGAMPSLNDIISTGSQQGPNQVSYSITKTVQQDGSQPQQSNLNSTYKTSTTTNMEGGPNSTTTEVRKIVTTQQPSVESSYYSKKVTTKTTTTTTTSTRGNGPTTQTNSRYGNTSTSGGRGNQASSYSRPGAQTSKTTTTTVTVQRGQYGPNSSNTSSQVYRGNQRNPAQTITGSQSYSGNKYQPKRPDVQKSYKPRAKSPEPGSIKRKTINRGNPIENVQITHIIYSSGPADFHITEDLNFDNLKTSPIQISKAERAKLQRSGKVSATCSCDGVEIAQPKKVNLKGSTTHYQHARGIGMTNDRKENINPQFYSSEIKKLAPIVRQKDEEKIENVETFRSAGKAYNSPSPGKSSTKTKTTTTYNRNQNQNSRGGVTSNTSRGMASSTVNRGGTSSMTTRGGMGNSRGGGSSTTKTTTTVYRGGNMGDGGDGEIIKETNTRVQMGSRSYKNTSQPTTTVSHERKVYNQKNFFNK